jgi:hypothetical protein
LDAEAWFLLVPAQVYPQAEGSFSTAKKVVEGWSAFLGSEQGRGILRAYLEQMAAAQGSGATG